MNSAAEIAAVVLAALLSYVGVEFFRRKSVARNWFDVPNERSSHSRPTPRGGGLVVVTICLISYIFIAFFAPATFSWGYLTGAALLATVSWADDLYSISVRWRLAVHFVSALLVVFSNGYFEVLGLTGNGGARPGAFGSVITVLWIVWMINAYNFMDGIDGIAGAQAMVAALAWAVVSSIIGEPQMGWYCLVVLGAASGFLAHNWSPARVFLGDVGSAFLGYTFASLPLLAGRGTGSLRWLPLAALFFLWPFVFDSAFTFAKRLIKGERVWEPHRKHLYQMLIIAGYSHSTVALAYLALAAISAISFLIVIRYTDVVGTFPILFLLVITIIFVFAVFWLTQRTADKQIVHSGGN